MNTTVKCEKCEWTRTYPGKEKAQQGLAMHNTMKHGKGVAAIQKHNRQPRKQRKIGTAQPLLIAFCPSCGCNIAAHNTAALMMGGVA